MKEFKIVLMSPQELIPYETNVKKHPPEQVKRIAQSIMKFGFDQPIVVDKHFVIIKGHGRRLGSIEAGLEKVPVLVRDDLTDEQVRAARLSDNRVALSDIDTDMLRMELELIDLDDLMGIFDDKELEFMTADLGDMNIEAFIDDIEGAVAEQKETIEETTRAAAEKRVPLIKAIGFKDIKASDQIYLNRFMAQIEAQSGMTGEEAFMNFIRLQTEQ